MTSDKHLALDALRTALGNIRPQNGNWHDLSGRVFPTLINPTLLPFAVQPGERWVYVCVPLVQDASGFESVGTMLRRHWTVSLWGFAGESEGLRTSSSETEDIAKLEDDILAAVLGDGKLSGTCERCRPVSSEASAGWPTEGGRRWGEMRMKFEITQRLGLDTLGP